MIVEATAPRRENVRNTFWFSQKLSMTGSEGEAYDSIERKSRTIAAGGTAEKSRTMGPVSYTHLVQCQNERSQFQNKDKAMQMLKAKLYLLKQEENAEKLSDIRGEIKDIAWGNQIRSYVLQPYKLVKDLRTNQEVANADGVLDGGLDPFINAYLKWINTKDKATEE